MKKIILLTVILFFIPSLVCAEDHYVTQNGGSGSMSVGDFNNADRWSSVANTNDGFIGPGDTVYFSGKFTTKIFVQGSGTAAEHIKLDGYEPDDTTYMYLSEAPGRALFDLTQARNHDNIAIDMENKNYIDIVDFEFTDSYRAIDIGGTSSYITVERCYAHTLSRNLVYIAYGTSITVGGSRGNGCVAKNIGQGTADADIVTVDTDNLVISYNHLYANSDDYGTDGITLHSTYDVLIEYNSIHGHNDAIPEEGENGIDIKEDSYNIIIRYNKIYDHDYESGIILNGRTEPYPQSADQVYIYGNLFFGGNAPGISSQENAGEYYDDVYIFSNIFHDMGHRAISLAESGDYSVFNNVIAECSITGSNSYDAGVYVGGSTAALKNNIYYNNRPNDASCLQLSVSTYADVNTISDHNRYYCLPGQTSTFRWGDAGTYITLSQIQDGNTQGLPQERQSSEGDPGLVDVANNDYRIATVDSDVVVGGVEMGSGVITTLTIQGEPYPVYWDIGLGPNTDWSGIIPVIDKVRRDAFGWDQGAYVYTGDEPSTCPGYCCILPNTCPGTNLGTFTGCSGTCCTEECQQPPQECTHFTAPLTTLINYDDVAPSGYYLEDNYGGLGADHNGWIYHCVDGYYTSNYIEDTAVFRYNSNTGEKQFLGTLRGITQAEGNLDPEEEIAKVHAPIHEYNGKMYFASHSFHSAQEAHRGAHFYSFDLVTETWTDLSKFDPGGVSVPGQGIITMEILRNHNKLVGFTYPKGEIVTYDLATQRSTNHGRPIASDPWNVARHIVATDAGKVYFAYANYDTPLYEFDVNTGSFSNTGFTLHYGWMAGSTVNNAGTKAYFVNSQGYIYSIDVYSGAITEMGTVNVPEHSGYSIAWIHGLKLSPDETRLYTAPEVKDSGGNLVGACLYEYEISTGAKQSLANLKDSEGLETYLIGVAIDNEGGLYYHSHNYNTNIVRLVRLYEDCSSPTCSNGQTQPCSTGQSGICSAGTQSCSGGSWGTCTSNNNPVAEICINGLDDDCDGLTDCQDSECSSHPSCFTDEEDISYSFKTYMQIVIDGELSEDAWSHAHRTVFSNPSRSDNLVEVRTLWDTDSLYFAYNVADQQLEAANQSLWNDDGAELYLDTGNEKGTSMDSNDYHFTVNIYDLTQEQGIQSVTKHDTDGYTMEMSIPWSGISSQLSFGMVMGLLLANNDRDSGVSSQFDWLDLIETGPYNRPNLWGDVLFTVRADSSRDGCVHMDELVPFINSWKYDSTAYPMREMMEAVTLYYSPGNWC